MHKIEMCFSQVANMTLTLPESAVKEHAPCVTSAINQTLAKAKSLFLLENPVSFQETC